MQKCTPFLCRTYLLSTRSVVLKLPGLWSHLEALSPTTPLSHGVPIHWFLGGAPGLAFPMLLVPMPETHQMPDHIWEWLRPQSQVWSALCHLVILSEQHLGFVRAGSLTKGTKQLFCEVCDCLNMMLFIRLIQTCWMSTVIEREYIFFKAESS